MASNNKQIDRKAPKHVANHAAPSSSKSSAKTVATTVGVILLLIAVAAASFYFYAQWQLQQAQQRFEQTGTVTPQSQTASSDQPQLVQSPVDFGELKADNPDIYAWIYIPDTNINYPILQSIEDDNYYLTRNVDKVTSFEGAIYSQKINATDFSDPVTLIYGHNIYSPQMMFHQLHLFEDASFFQEHDTFYIYTPGHLLTYRIVAAYEYDNRHIMNTFDFSNTTVLEEYFASVLNPQSLVSHVRDGEVLTDNDKIVQLSTCVASGAENQRYIVTGRLTNDQPTY